MPTIFVDKSVENESLACIIAYKSRLAWACLKNKPKINFFKIIYLKNMFVKIKAIQIFYRL